MPRKLTADDVLAVLGPATYPMSWSEQQVVEELVGALISAAALIAYRPAVDGRIQAAVLARLGEPERVLLSQLHGAGAADSGTPPLS